MNPVAFGIVKILCFSTVNAFPKAGVDDGVPDVFDAYGLLYASDFCPNRLTPDGRSLNLPECQPSAFPDASALFAHGSPASSARSLYASAVFLHPLFESS